MQKLAILLKLPFRIIAFCYILAKVEGMSLTLIAITTVAILSELRVEKRLERKRENSNNPPF